MTPPLPMQNSSFNLVQTIAVLQKQWKMILLFVLGSVIAATIAVFFVPNSFKATATIVSANPVLADKARLFNTNIQSLYSYFGSGDDLDRIYGVADMDTTYKKIVDEFSLVSYYQLNNDSLPILRRKAVLLLRKDLTLQKTEQAQLKLIAWTKDKEMSAAIVNRMVAIIQETEASIWQKNYQQAQSKLTISIAQMETDYKLLSDSNTIAVGGKRDLAIANMQTLLEQIKQYRKTAGEFVLATQTPPAVLYVMEPGVPAAKAERPDKPMIIFIALMTGIVFSCLWVLINDRKNIA
jgi:LPS O-antigen subunit length determinant protein (WzzB/FepE family)